MMTRAIDPSKETIYDHPLYYDILFSWDRTQEADFYQTAFQRFGIHTNEGVLEVACGSGQVGRVLAQRGWRITGLDNREPILSLLRERAAALGVAIATLCADMVDFRVRERFGAAFIPLSSLLLLPSDQLAEAHFAAMAQALRSGGLYILDLGFGPEVHPDAETTDETWEVSRGDITVRAQDDAVYVDDAGAHRILPWSSGTPYWVPN